jgi:hypothetical protein
VKALLVAPGRMSTSFVDPSRSVSRGSATQALAVARSPDSLPDWTLILEQDVDAALRPITALNHDFQTPARTALTSGFVALVLLAVLLWRGGHWRELLGIGGPARMDKDRIGRLVPPGN